MTSPDLTRPRSPWVVFTCADDPWVTAETAALQEQGGLVFRLDGRDLLEPASLFRTFARELSFLGYFGHNWHALVDCLHDWHGPGHGERNVAVLIEHADALLGKEFLGLFVSVLCEAAWNANLQLDGDGVPHEDRPPFALHFVLLLDHTSPADFAEDVLTDVGVALADGRLTATLTDDDGSWPGADPAAAFPGVPFGPGGAAARCGRDALSGRGPAGGCG
ncbi:barstar family protein [Streptomyces sp. MB09-01]|uniref:barstar family protein n=1 Tax=Streptomyces sp. MB09-01 TaxID=3028666 RepID=UPI0029A9E502|nr:barstar family protein [Streptomyces sp. MB09-01]MDX3537081.1 barstar family protein [Streptomyces sp. MB09-01]